MVAFGTHGFSSNIEILKVLNDSKLVTLGVKEKLSSSVSNIDWSTDSK